MRLARFRTRNGYQVFASHGERWVRLPITPGSETRAGLAELACDPRRSEIALIAEQQSNNALTEVGLAEAATIVGIGDALWGAGLNYRRHSKDLETAQPSFGPGSYLRPGSCLIDNGQSIELPLQSERVTAEAELGLVIGVECKNVERDEWRSVVAGVTTVLDMTAEDIIRENPRYIPWAKGFDTFCSVGPQLVTMDEFGVAGLDSLYVTTIRNGETIATAPVSDMKYDLGYLVAYFTAGRTIEPGTVLCTGTPGAAVINTGDSIQATVEGVGTLQHSVR